MSNSPMRFGRETRRFAAERGHKGSSIVKLITRRAMDWVALRNDLLGDDNSAAPKMMDPDDALRDL